MAPDAIFPRWVALLRLKFGAHIRTIPVGTYAPAWAGIHARRDFKMYRYPPAAVISLLSVTFAALPATIPGTKVRNG
jgi:hypothetical protein